jgi:Flp pilus assembly protein TadD
MRRAEEDGATLIVNSDHGFKWGEDRSCSRDSLNPATAGFWHRLDGVFAAWGARVKKGDERGSATVFDVAPTVSALLSIPVDRRAAGSVIRGAFPGLAAPARRDLSSVPVRRLATDAVSDAQANEYTKKLLALGYLSGGEPGKLAPPGGDRPGLTEGGWNNLGLYLSLSGGPARNAEAEAAFKKALALRPDYHSPQFNLAGLYRREGRDRDAIDWLFRSFDTGHADPAATARSWASEYEQGGKPAPARAILERAAAKYPEDEGVARQLAVLRFKAGDCASAQAAVSRFEAATRDPDTLNILALLSTCTGHPDAAIGLFRRSLAIKPDQPGAVRSLEMLEKGLPPGTPKQ